MWIFRNTKARKSLEETPVEENYHERLRYLADHDMPLDLLLAAELAQIQTFAIPSISTLLHRTRQYEDHSTKRLDDTRAILTECLSDSVHSEHGQHMVEHLNFIHGHYKISNEDYLYTLALFMVEPARWCEKFGYRALTDDDKTALYLEFRDLGEAMKIQSIPESFEAMDIWYQAYRKKHMAFDSANRAVTEGLIKGMQQMLPGWVQPISNGVLRTFVLTLLDDPAVMNALGIKPPAAPIRVAIKNIMKLRAVILRWINPWQNRSFDDSVIKQHYATYPNGYQPNCLGPDKIVRRDKSPAGQCPFHDQPHVTQTQEVIAD